MKFTLIVRIETLPKEVYATWLDSKGHSNMTGGQAEIYPEVGRKFSAWDDYIQGENIELIPNEKIVQSWRTTQFEEEEPDSHLEILLKLVDGHTELTLTHSALPESGSHYKKGWDEHYFIPMKEYFQSKK